MDDPVRLAADQPRQFLIRLGDAALEKLGGTADPGQGILDLVRQDSRHGGDRAGGVTMDKLVAHLAGDRAFVEADDDLAWRAIALGLGNRGHAERDQALSQARRGQRDLVTEQAMPGVPCLAQTVEERAVCLNEAPQRPAQEGVGASGEELLGRLVDVGQAVLAVDHDQRLGQGVEDDLGG